MEDKTVPQVARVAGPRKYLINWSLKLGREELARIAVRPEAMEKGLNYMKSMMKGSRLELYRIVPMEELTKFVRPEAVATSAHPTGIAIAEAGSIEEVRKMVEHWAEGFSYGGVVSVKNYLEFEIHPLMQIGHGDRE